MTVSRGKRKLPERVIKTRKISTKYHIDCTKPVEDGILNISDFKKYLRQHIKVNGKTNNFGKSLSVDATEKKIAITADIPFSKRYLKYLTKKYLVRNSLRDWVRVIARSDERNSYELKYFKIYNDDEQESDED